MIQSSVTFEDRKTYVAEAEVLRATSVSTDATLQAYADALEWKVVLRPVGAMPKSGVFYSSETRDIMEAEFLRVGCDLLSRCRNPKKSMKPLGYSTMPILGFGSLFMTYRNCPNNAPLALWWSVPTIDRPAWYPLLPRRTAKPAIAPGSMAEFLEHVAQKSETTAEAPAAAAPAIAIAANEVEEHERGGGPEDGAREWLSRHLEGLEFDISAGVARLPVEGGYEEFSTRDTLEYHLAEIYDDEWTANAPLGGDDGMCDPDGISVPIEMLEDSFSDELTLMGWD